MIRDRFETANVHVDIFDRHRVILDEEECELVQVAIYREGRPEDMLGFDADSKLARRIVRPVFEAALTYEAATGVIEVVASTREDRVDLTRFMARDLLGIDFEEKPIPLREYDLSVLLKPFDFPTDPADGIEGVTVKELRFMDLGDPKEGLLAGASSGRGRDQPSRHCSGAEGGALPDRGRDATCHGANTPARRGARVAQSEFRREAGKSNHRLQQELTDH